MPTTSPPTKRGTRKLSEVARHLVAPKDIASTSWPAVRKTCNDKLGITFDDWQDGAGRLILAKRSDGNLAAMVDGVGLSLPRQVGKTYLVGAMVFALCVNMPGLLVIWSAHHARTHAETFLAMQGFAARSKVKGHIGQIFKGSGDEEIRFHNGSRILFGARERGFGRGIPGVDILIFDEAQILSDKALSNMLATMNTSRFGLQLYIGTPPKPEDMSEAFTRMRTEALEGRLSDGAWIELGADKGADPGDKKQWAKANPSYPLRTPEQSIRRLRRKLTLEDFLREGMGVWDDAAGDALLPNWPVCKKDDLEPVVFAIGLAVAKGGGSASIAAAGMEGDHVIVGAVDHRPSQDWLVDEAARIQAERGCHVVVDEVGPTANLIPALKAAGVNVKTLNTSAVANASASFQARVQEKTLWHPGHPDLDRAVALAVARDIGDGRWAWGRKKSAGDISMLEAATNAAWISTTAGAPTIW